MLQIGMLPLSRAIYLWRIEKGLTQEDLARLSGIPRPNLSMIEQGARDLTLSTLRRLAHALNVKPGLLADGIPPESYAHRKWSRENLDRIARYIAGRSVSLSPEEKRAANLIRPFVSQKIRLKGRLSKSLRLERRNARKERQSLIAARSRFSNSEISSLLDRIDKLGERTL